MYRQILILILFFCFVATPALAAGYDEDTGRPYLTLSGGVSKVYGVDFDDSVLATSSRATTDYGYNGMVATGLSYDAGRIELSAGYHYMNFDEVKINGAPATPLDGNINAYDLLLSAFYDFNKSGTLSPYIGGGVGAARVTTDSGGVEKNDIAFAYQLGAGLSLNMSEDFAVDLGYRLLGVNNASIGDNQADMLLFHSANMGFRFLF